MDLPVWNPSVEDQKQVDPNSSPTGHLTKLQTSNQLRDSVSSHWLESDYRRHVTAYSGLHVFVQCVYVPVY